MKNKIYTLKCMTTFARNSLQHICIWTSISANVDGPRDAASRKIDHIALPTKYNYQATSVDWWQIATQT